MVHGQFNIAFLIKEDEKCMCSSSMSVVPKLVLGYLMDVLFFKTLEEEHLKCQLK